MENSRLIETTEYLTRVTAGDLSRTVRRTTICTVVIAAILELADRGDVGRSRVERGRKSKGADSKDHEADDSREMHLRLLALIGNLEIWKNWSRSGHQVPF